MKNQLNSLAAPRTWNIRRKKEKFTMKPKGPHKLENSIAIGTLFRQYLKNAKTSREVKDIINSKGVLVNGHKVKDVSFGAGLMDLVEIPGLNKKYIILINRKGKLCLVDTELDTKIAKISGKKKVNGKIQLNLFGGDNLIVEKDESKVGDSVLLDLKSGKIKDSMKLAEGSACILLGGSHIGEFGTVKEVDNKKITIIGKDKTEFETLKKLVYIVGKKEPLIKIKNEFDEKSGN